MNYADFPPVQSIVIPVRFITLSLHFMPRMYVF